MGGPRVPVHVRRGQDERVEELWAYVREKRHSLDSDLACKRISAMLDEAAGDYQRQRDEAEDALKRARVELRDLRKSIKPAGAAPVPASVDQAPLETLVGKPHWPEGLEAGVSYKFRCDDKGRDGGTFFAVMVDEQGDAYLSSQDWEDVKEPGSSPMPFTSVRCRTYAGGGRCTHVRQALLWLAHAIRIDCGADQS